MRYIRNFFIFIFCILLFSYLALQIPVVRKITIEKSIEYVNANADFTISYENFLCQDLKDISFSNVIVEGKKNKQELLKVQKLQIGLDIINLFLKKELNLKKLEFVDLVVFIDKNKNIFFNSETESEKKNLRYFQSFSVNIENINFFNCSLFYDNDDIAKHPESFFDINHFNISKINSHFENIILSKYGVSGCVKCFAAESGKILLEELSGEIECHDKLCFKKVSAKSNLGELAGNFEILDLEKFSYVLDLQKLVVKSKKIPGLKKLQSEVAVECVVNGDKHESRIEKFRCCYDKNSASFSGVVNFDTLAYDLKNVEGKFNLKTLEKIIPMEVIKKIPCHVGTFNGALKVKANKGNVIFNIHSKGGEVSSNFDFENIFSKDFKLDGKVNLQNVYIKDFNVKDLNSVHTIIFSKEEKKVENKISNVNYNDVNINDVEFNVYGDEKKYEGVLRSLDNNLKVDLNFKNYDNNIFCSGKCDLQNLNKIWGEEKKIDIKNEINVKIKKDRVDAVFNNNYLKIDDVTFDFKFLKTNFNKEGKHFHINIFSDILDFKVYDIPENYQEIKGSFIRFCQNLYNWSENKPMTIANDPNFKIPFYINIKDGKTFKFFSQAIICDNTNIYGDFVHTNGKKFFNINIDKIENIQILEQSFKNTDLYIMVGLNEKLKIPIININCEIDKVNFKNFYADNIICKIVSHGKNINTNLSLKSNMFKFDWDVKSFFEDGKIIFDLQDENSTCSFNSWMMEKNGCIKVAFTDISIENLAFVKNKMSFICDFKLAKKEEVWKDEFSLQIKNANVENWKKLLPYDVKGVINGDIKKSSLSFLDINFNLNDLIINENNFGSLVLTTKYDMDKRVYNYSLLAKKEENISLDLNGIFYETNKKINARCFFDNFDLKVVEVFCVPVCSKLEGLLTGHLNIFGNFLQPNFWGDVELNDGKILFIPINSEFKTKGLFKGDVDGLNVTNLEFSDDQGGSAVLSGKIKINFTDFPQLNLAGKANEIQVLNTTEEDNDAFYGKLFCSGDVQFYGPVNFLTINGNVQNVKNSNIFLNLKGEDDNSYGFIHFIDKNDKISSNVKQQTNIKSNGIRLNIDTTLDQNLKTLIKIPFSEIKIRGIGKIHILTTFNNDFNFKGNFTVKKGSYLLSLKNLIGKKFKIEKGGSFNFLGDISAATLDIVATEDIFMNDSDENVVTLKVLTTGLIQDPELKYDIDLSKSKNIDPKIKSKITTNDDMRKYYFLNLLLFRNFEPNSSINPDLFNIFKEPIKILDKKSNFKINLKTEKIFIDNTSNLDLGYTYDKFEILKQQKISNKKMDLEDLLDDIEVRYAINKDSQFYTNLKKNKIKFGIKLFS